MNDPGEDYTRRMWAYKAFEDSGFPSETREQIWEQAMISFVRLVDKNNYMNEEMMRESFNVDCNHVFRNHGTPGSVQWCDRCYMNWHPRLIEEWKR